MAIDIHQFKMILDSKAKGTALSAGYPDLLVKREDIPVADDLTPRSDSAKWQEHHSWNWPIYDTGEVFKALGLELHVVDREKIQGTEQVIDLNFPHDFGEFDLVIDPGTIEHCFNIGQAAVNLAASVKIGGFISQAVPMSMFNHGYYNLNPKWFLDFYRVNGFEVKRLVIRASAGIFEPLQRGARYKGVLEESVLICLAQRIERVAFAWPVDK